MAAPTPNVLTADQLIRELRALIARRGWVASGSGVDAQGAITVIARRGWVASGSGVDAQGAITVSARPKTEDE